ncbi:hypothetical protein [Streptomyces sp. YIM S03343]
MTLTLWLAAATFALSACSAISYFAFLAIRRPPDEISKERILKRLISQKAWTFFFKTAWNNAHVWLCAKWSLFILALLFSTYAIVDNLSATPWNYRLLAGFAGVACLFGLLLAQLKRRSLINPQSIPQDQSRPVGFTQLQRARAIESLDHFLNHEFQKDLTGMQHFLLTVEEAITTPDAYLDYAETCVTIKHHSIEANVSLTYNIPQIDHGKNLFLPVIWAQKGSVQQDLELTDRENKYLPRLTQGQTKAILSIVIESLFCEAYCRGDLPDSKDDRALRNTLVDHVWTVGPLDTADREDVLNKLNKRLGHGANDTQAAQPAHERLIALYKILCDYYVILAEVKTYSRCIIRYKRTLPVAWGLTTTVGSPSIGSESRVYSHIRLLTGGHPNKIFLPIWVPFLARAYRLTVRGSDDQYITGASLLCRRDSETVWRQFPVAAAEEPPPEIEPYFRSQPPSGLPYTLFYIRGLARAPQIARVLSIIRFTEVPPGVLGMATISNALMTLFITCFTLLSIRYNALLTPQSALPGLIFGLVIAAIPLFGIATDRDSVLRASASARLGLLGLVATYLFGAFLYFNLRWMKKATDTITILGFWTLHSVNLWWLGLSCASLLITITLTVILICRTYRYLRDVKRRSNYGVA